MTRFIEIRVQEKCRGDFRGFAICEKDGERWELRGDWADNPGDAAKNAYTCFLDTEWWHLHGYVIE
jgi:hypothetical protein